MSLTAATCSLKFTERKLGTSPAYSSRAWCVIVTSNIYFVIFRETKKLSVFVVRRKSVFLERKEGGAAEETPSFVFYWILRCCVR